ncbi:alpha/beta hydrolase [Streptomyces sp. NPDC019396]|uniref:alpha/beta fold hydrolase n=1 Tax=Streptomyces sp. NPDC019396 TaxID=3154687 RepID=UPI0033E1309E
MDTFSYPGSDGHPLHATRLGMGPAAILLPDSGGPYGSGGPHSPGGPDHRGLLPLARRLADSYTVTVAETRDADDVASLVGHLGLRKAAVGGTGTGAAIALRAAADDPEHIAAAVVINADDLAPEDIAHTFGRMAALAAVSAPTLIIPGGERHHRRHAHPHRHTHAPGLAEELARVLPQGKLANLSFSADLCSAEDMAQWMAPAMWAFLTAHLTLRPARVLV